MHAGSHRGNRKVNDHSPLGYTRSVPERRVTPSPRIFLLSPANCGGERARILLSPRASFPLAERVRAEGAPLGDVFSFLSGLYFRGKLAYARAFARPPARRGVRDGVLVITADRGLRPADEPLTLRDLQAAAGVDIRHDNPRYRLPLEASAQALAEQVGRRCDVVLLGSVASDKYVTVLREAFGERLRFPAAFVGRGDMSRGGLLLRCVAEGRELDYIPLDGAERRGPRPPKLPPLPRARLAARG